MRKIVLHGILSEHIPDGYFMADVHSAREAASAIEVNFPGFRDKIKDMSVDVWHTNDGKEVVLSEDQLSWMIGSDEIHIAPALEGAGRGGKAILGVALFAVGVFATGGTLAGFGAAAFGNTLGITAGQLILTGGLLVLNTFLAPKVPSGDFGQNETERKPSAIYRGPLNTQEQGVSFPLVFGFGVIAGGSVIHGDLQIGQVTVETKT